MIGRTYLEHGEPVTVLVSGGGRSRGGLPGGAACGRSPRNVLVRRADGSLVVRAARGLRRDPARQQMAAVITAIQGCRLARPSETVLQEAIAEVLAESGIAASREHRLDGASRIDFLAGRAGIEVKVDGSPATVTRQLLRYARFPQVGGLVLVTTRAAHRVIPTDLGGKPVQVAWISGLTR